MADSEFRGVEEFLQRLGALSGEIREAAGSGLYDVGEEIIGDSQENYVPVDEGILKGSGFVNEPENRDNEIVVTLGYGGPAQDYAAVQHARTDFQHTVGQAKYLSEPAERRANVISTVVSEAIGRKLRG